MKKIRVISDLHLDINKDYRLSMKDYDDCFTILAGDTSGDPRVSIRWIRKNIKNGIVVCGNHLVYNKQQKTVSQLRKQFGRAFPIDNGVTYFDNGVGVMSKVVDGILFVGTCLYTDYKLKTDYNPDGDVEKNKRLACPHFSGGGLNDFRWGALEYEMEDRLDYITGETKKRKVIKRFLHPSDLESEFHESFKKIDEIITENEKSEKPLPVVVITHHAPSPRCISDIYSHDDLNASYASDLEWFIKEHKSIKAWCCGHIHDHKVFKVERDDGTSCVVVQNPCGYIHCWYYEPSHFNPNTFINTETWEVEEGDPNFNKRISKETERSNRMNKLAIAAALFT